MNRLNSVELHFEDNDLAQSLFGPHESHLKNIEKRLKVTIRARGNHVNIQGEKEAVQFSENILNQLYDQLKRGHTLLEQEVDQAITVLSDHIDASLDVLFDEAVVIPGPKRTINPKTIAQKQYIQAMKKHAITFGIGPAGTGKTYLAMAKAVSSLLQGEVKRIILTRPAVEAGEKLGFLPGSLVEKVDPYLRPLYDALNDMLDIDKTQKLLDRGEIEVAPLAFMRGRTLNDAYVILDEAQNTTREQMKMFLTRIGFNSQAVITGDISQIDLPRNTKSGLIHAIEVLDGVQGIAMQYLTDKDVVRHPLVQEIVKAYDRFERREENQPRVMVSDKK